MLRRILLASAGAMALAGTALAADLGAPPPPPPPVFTWTGFYVGLNAGYHWGGPTLDFTGTDTDGAGLGSALDAGAIPATGANGADGFIGGGQTGYNYQIDSFVLGLELDVDGATGLGSSNVLLGPNVGFDPITTGSEQRLDWLGTLRGRIGWTPIERLLIYGTGGLAFGKSTASFSVVAPAGLPPLADFVSSSVSVGWAAGGGIEYALPDNWSNWSVKVEYLYYDLGNTSTTAAYVYAPESSTLTGQIRHSGNIVRAGLNYKFDYGAPAPVVAKY